MQIQSMHFQARSTEKLADTRLQRNLRRLADKFVTARADSMTEIDFEATRESAVERRNRSIEKLDLWLELFEQRATESGATVLFAESAAQASEMVLAIAKKHGAKTVTKSKSMVSEEMALNDALSAAGVEPIETDLGEYILQINDNEAPSHIIAPVIHKDKEEISELFSRVHQQPRLSGIPELTREAREQLRPKFMEADMGVTGGNFVIAETGSVALVTNEGNEGMVTIMPKVHVVVTGIEKVLPTLEDFATMLRLLTRSATGQSISNYVSLLTGVRAADEPDGPDHLYFVLVDGGRSSLLGSEFQDMLRCIRCGACMNHCPVYQKIGGHAYGWVYPGPMGSVLTPSYQGLENTLDLPQAATLCGECHVVCPVSIPLPNLLRKLRERQFERHLRPFAERMGLAVWAYVAARTPLYRLVTSLVSVFLRLSGGRRHRIGGLAVANGWSQFRDIPTPRGGTFSSRYPGWATARALAKSQTRRGPR